MLKPTRLRPAFTLIELLMVISIVAVLAGLLMPAIAQVKGAAQSLQCGNNLRQLGLGMQSYAVDWDGILVPLVQPVPNGTVGSGGNAAGYFFSWDTNLLRQLDYAAATITCPLDRTSPRLTRTLDLGFTRTSRRSYSYVCGWNPAFPDNYRYSTFDRSTFRAKTLMGIADHSGTALLVDRVNAVNCFCDPWAGNVDRTDNVSIPHRTRANWLFLDGHVGLHTLAESAGTGNTTSPGIGGQNAKGFWTTIGGD
jgi:prepilin-type N-terminal cleavage/methylation domain-containing protein/prepilin-type processing-associated H-X9-DG protein